MIVGRVKEVWRYPVKSMAGERLEGSGVGEWGLSGDRGWALRDEEAGEIRGAKKSPALILCAARYREQPAGAGAPPPHADITLPGGFVTATDAPDVNERLSELVGRRVTLWPVQAASDRAHYRRAMPLAQLPQARAEHAASHGARRLAARGLRPRAGRAATRPLRASARALRVHLAAGHVL